MKLNLFVLFVCLSICNVTNAQNILNAEIKLLPDKIPAINIPININGDTVFTDINGAFKYSTNKEVKIIININGYFPFEKIISSSQNLNIELQSSVKILDDVVIESNTKKITNRNRDITSINPEQLNYIPAITGTTDIVKLLQLLPGVQNSGEANGHVYVRGGDPGHNIMIYENAPVYGTTHLLGLFPFYNADHIGEVEFDKNGSNLEYGDRIGSAIKIKTRAKPNTCSIKGNLGLLASQATIASNIGKKSGFILSGRTTYIDIILGKLLNAGAKDKDNEVEDIGYYFYDSNLTFITEFNKKHQLKIDGFISNDNFSIESDNMLLKGSIKWKNNLISPVWQWKIADNYTLTTSMHYSYYSNKIDVSQANVALNTYSGIQDIGFKSKLNYYISKLNFETGIDGAFYEIEAMNLNTANFGTNSKIQDIKSNKIGIYNKIDFNITENLLAKIGTRLNYYRCGKSFFNFEPSLELNYFNKVANLYTNFNIRNQYLNLITNSTVGLPTDFWISSTKNIPAQKSYNYVLGANKSWKNFNFDISVFYRNMDNLAEYPYSLLQFNEITSIGNDIHIGKGESYGLEFMFRYETNRLNLFLSYTLSKADRTFPTFNDGNSFFAKYDRKHNLSISGMYKFSNKWTVAATQLIATGSRISLPNSWYIINNNPVKEYGSYNGAKMNDYLRTDFSVNYNISKNSILSLSVYNTFVVKNPIYTVLSVSIDDENSSVKTRIKNKTLYTILPSINWIFKF